MTTEQTHHRWFRRGPAERTVGTAMRSSEPLIYWSNSFGQFFIADWDQFRKKQKHHARRLEQYLDDHDSPWLAGSCGGHFDRGSFAATADSLVFIPKTNEAEEVRNLGRRYQVRDIADLAYDRESLLFVHEGNVIKIPFPAAFWPLAMRFPDQVSGTVVVRPDEVREALAAGHTKQLSLSHLTGTEGKAVSAIQAAGSATYATTVHDIVFRSPSDAPYFQRLNCPICGDELWVQVQKGEPDLRRYLPERGLMCHAEGVDEVVAAQANTPQSVVRFARHRILDRRRPDHPIWRPPAPPGG